MKIENQVVSLDLSKRLKELGFKQDSLFYWWSYEDDFEGSIKWKIDHKSRLFIDDNVISAYTVAELGEMLPAYIETWKLGNLSKDKKGWFACLDREDEKEIVAETEADARAKMLIYLKEDYLI